MISFFFHDTPELKFLRSSRKFWLDEVCRREDKKLGNVNIIFCSDEYLLGINRQFLGHDYYTDIITFDDCEGNTVNGELYISVDTVRANAEEYSVSFQNELDRVMVHGVLHLLGHDDKTDGQRAEMRNKEDYCLGLLDALLRVRSIMMEEKKKNAGRV